MAHNRLIITMSLSILTQSNIIDSIILTYNGNHCEPITFVSVQRRIYNIKRSVAIIIPLIYNQLINPRNGALV